MPPQGGTCCSRSRSHTLLYLNWAHKNYLQTDMVAKWRTFLSSLLGLFIQQQPRKRIMRFGFSYAIWKRDSPFSAVLLISWQKRSEEQQGAYCSSSLSSNLCEWLEEWLTDWFIQQSPWAMAHKNSCLLHRMSFPPDHFLLISSISYHCLQNQHLLCVNLPSSFFLP